MPLPKHFLLPVPPHNPRPLALPLPCLTLAHPPLAGRVRLAVQGQAETEVRVAVHWPNRNLQYLQAQKWQPLALVLPAGLERLGPSSLCEE